MNPTDAVPSVRRSVAVSSVTLSKQKWLVNWFCFTISSRISLCIYLTLSRSLLPHDERRHFTLIPREHQSGFCAEQLYKSLRRIHTLFQIEPVDSWQVRFVDHLCA